MARALSGLALLWYHFYAFLNQARPFEVSRYF